MLLYFDRPHGYYLNDMLLGGDPLRPFVRSGLFSKDAHPVDLADFERWQMVDMNGVEAGLVVQNLMLATQALGLGGHPFSGGKGRVTMGGEPLWEAAGGSGPCEVARLHLPPRARRRSGRGRARRSRSGCPGSSRAPARRSTTDMDAAVDHVVGLRWGKDGIFSAPEKQQVPWTSPEVARAVPPPSERGDRGHEDALQLHLGHLRPLPGDASTRS